MIADNATGVEHSHVLTRSDNEPWKLRYRKRNSSWSAACRPASVMLSIWMYDVSTLDDRLPVSAIRSSLPNEPGRNGSCRGSKSAVRSVLWHNDTCLYDHEHTLKPLLDNRYRVNTAYSAASASMIVELRRACKASTLISKTFNRTPATLTNWIWFKLFVTRQRIA